MLKKNSESDCSDPVTSQFQCQHYIALNDYILHYTDYSILLFPVPSDTQFLVTTLFLHYILAGGGALCALHSNFFLPTHLLFSLASYPNC